MPQKIATEEKLTNQCVCFLHIFMQKTKSFNFQEGLVVGYTLYHSKLVFLNWEPLCPPRVQWAMSGDIWLS